MLVRMLITEILFSQIIAIRIMTIGAAVMMVMAVMMVVVEMFVSGSACIQVNMWTNRRL